MSDFGWLSIWHDLNFSRPLTIAFSTDHSKDINPAGAAMKRKLTKSSDH